MKNLLTVTTLVLFFSISSPSFGFDQMSLYSESPQEIVIAGEVSGDHIEKDFMDFYIDPLHPQLSEDVVDAGLLIANKAEDEDNYINVFGVKVIGNGARGSI